MSAFGGIEMAMAGIFSRLMRAEDPQAARTVFHSGIGFRGQLGMIDSLMQTAFPSDKSPAPSGWRKLRPRIKGAQEKRNRIAHMHVWRMRGHELFGRNPKKHHVLLPIIRKEMQGHVVTTKSLTKMTQEASLLTRDMFRVEDECSRALPRKVDAVRRSSPKVAKTET